ncbi:GD12009 [Drosophila simulans]|uniref:GD12009 n=1 Tax=Drosophila simulans TaxID=7240 RepID=B4NRU9_DROSI|nr:GD12009 [Drosophila simulans]
MLLLLCTPNEQTACPVAGLRSELSHHAATVSSPYIPIPEWGRGHFRTGWSFLSVLQSDCLAFALCWIIWACQNGLAPIVNEFLSWSFWQPLSKLSYCLYIWHLLVETVHIARIKTSPHFSDYDAILRFWSDFGITLFVSMFMHLCVEVPLGRLEMELLKRCQKKEDNPESPKETSTEPTEVIPATSISRQNLVDP